jgi:hypothetical protein
MLTDDWYGVYSRAERKAMMPKLDAYPVHPAKMDMGLAQAIFEKGLEMRLWDRGNNIGNPMAGDGTEALIFRRGGCPIYAVEPVPLYAARFGIYQQRLQDTLPYKLHTWHMHLGDAREAWPKHWPLMDAVVFSPTYEAAVKAGDEGPYAKGLNHLREAEGVPVAEGLRKRITGYDEAPGQIGALKGQDWQDAMKLIYQRSYEHTIYAGLMVTVTKNVRRNSTLVDIAAIVTADAGAVGWQPYAHFRALGAARSLFARTNNQHYIDAGHSELVVNHEDILVFQKSSQLQGVLA